MYPAPFEYHRPENLLEAIALMGEFGDDGMLMAGGQTLIPRLKRRLETRGQLIDIRLLDGISGIRREQTALIIGGTTTHGVIERSELVRTTLPVLGRTASLIGDIAVRNLGTIGGNLASVDPHADWPALVLAFGSDIVLANPQGEKRIPAGEFFRNRGVSALDATDIITSVRFRIQPAHTGAAYVRQTHPASGFAMCGVAALVTLDEKGAIGRARLAITGVADPPARARAVERALIGRQPDAGTIRSVARLAADGLTLLDDDIASADYKAHLARVYTHRALQQATAGALGH